MMHMDDGPLYCMLAVVCATAAAVYDVREQRIPNGLSGSILAAGLSIHLCLQGWHGLASSSLAALVAGGLFLVLFVAGGMGAGDVKLMTAVAAVTGSAPLLPMLLATVTVGALYALLLATYEKQLASTLRNTAAVIGHHLRSGLRPHASLNLANQKTLRLPFAVPVTLGCAATFCITAWGR